jgi:hypothetical protein
LHIEMPSTEYFAVSNQRCKYCNQEHHLRYIPLSLIQKPRFP